MKDFSVSMALVDYIPVAFFAAAAVNIIFFLLCGYGQVMNPNEASYLDPFLGVIAVVVLAVFVAGVDFVAGWLIRLLTVRQG